MLEDGTCAFSRVPGDGDGMRRTPNFKKKTKESQNGAPNNSSAPDNTSETSPPSA